MNMDDLRKRRGGPPRAKAPTSGEKDFLKMKPAEFFDDAILLEAKPFRLVRCGEFIPWPSPLHNCRRFPGSSFKSTDRDRNVYAIVDAAFTYALFAARRTAQGDVVDHFEFCHRPSDVHCAAFLCAMDGLPRNLTPDVVNQVRDRLSMWRDGSSWRMEDPVYCFQVTVLRACAATMPRTLERVGILIPASEAMLRGLDWSEDHGWRLNCDVRLLEAVRSEAMRRFEAASEYASLRAPKPGYGEWRTSNDIEVAKVFDPGLKLAPFVFEIERQDYDVDAPHL